MRLHWCVQSNASHEFKYITHYQQHNLVIYGASPFKVEKLEQPQNVRATKCGKSDLPFPPSIKQNKSNAWVPL